jgi:16S rRNA (guanine1516-N2)-methyltransferase
MHLQLVQSAADAPGPIFVDFTSGQMAHRRQFGGGKGQVIAKAVGLNKNSSPLILDATTGMGKDAFVFASLGARVIMMERSPVSAALLQDGLERARLDDEVSAIIERMQLIKGDARFLISYDSLKLNEMPDVIYLDPMFPHRKKTALVKKEMLAFQQLIGDDKDSNELLSVCQQVAKKRVVVKRPIKAPWLDHKKPSLSMNMKKHRFDIYLK